MYVETEHTKRQVKFNNFLFSNMLFIVMFVTAVCVLFLINLLSLFSNFLPNKVGTPEHI